MNKHKITTFFITMTIIFSTTIVLNQFNIINQVSAQPGVDEWGDAASEIIYGESYPHHTIYLNTTGWNTGIHWLYYPTYECSTGAGRPAIEFHWDGPFELGGDTVYVDATGAEDDFLYTYYQSIIFNRSGMWIFDTDSDHATYDGYLWVNTTNAYTISPINDFPFGSSEDVAIEIKEGDFPINCRVALINPEGTTILNSATGADIVIVDANEFTMVGTYTVRAYKDLDDIQASYYYLDEVHDAAYDAYYGATFPVIPTNYSYESIGPWDPPEKNATEETFSVVEGLFEDYIGDVCSVNFTTQETTIITEHPDIDVDNLDIVSTGHDIQGSLVNLSMQVVGRIEDRGKPIDFYNETEDVYNFVEYEFIIIASEQNYLISYCNQTGLFSSANGTIILPSSNFSVIDNILSIWFSIANAEETFEALSVTARYVKMNISSGNISDFVYLADLAPNPPLQLTNVNVPRVGNVGEIIQFNASVMSFTGLPPYSYHWDFGDHVTSSIQNPTHIYLEAETYPVIVTVTDATGAIVSELREILIVGEVFLRKALIVGSYENITTQGDYLLFNAVDLRMTCFQPLEYQHLTFKEITIVSKHYFGIWTQHVIAGLFNVVSISLPDTPNIICTTDSTTNRITIATADSDIQWSDIQITTNRFLAIWQVYSQYGTVLDLPKHTDGITTEVLAGEYIQLQRYTGNVAVTMRYKPTNGILGTWTVNV